MRPSTTSHDPGAARQRKRARFEEARSAAPRSNATLYVVFAIIVLGTAWFGYVLGLSSSRTAPVDTGLAPIAQTPARPASSAPAPSPAPPARALEAQAGVFKIPLSEVTTTASYYSTNAGGTSVRFFAVRDASGAAHVALDACNTCSGGYGYTQVGDQMRCGKCGQQFPVASLTEMGQRGGCHPVSLGSRREGDTIVVASSEVAAGARFF